MAAVDGVVKFEPAYWEPIMLFSMLLNIYIVKSNFYNFVGELEVEGFFFLFQNDFPFIWNSEQWTILYIPLYFHI